MDKLPTDVLRHVAMNLDYEDIQKFCRTSSRFLNSICKSPNFWINRLKQDYNFTTKVENPFLAYSNIRKNKETCNELLLNSPYQTNPFLENVPNFLKLTVNSIDDILAFNFIIGKIFFHDKGIPNYFSLSHYRYLTKNKYKDRVTPSPEFTHEESLLFTEILQNFRNMFYHSYLRDKNKRDFFLFSYMNGILRGEIPYDLTLEQLCSYNLY